MLRNSYQLKSVVTTKWVLVFFYTEAKQRRLHYQNKMVREFTIAWFISTLPKLKQLFQFLWPPNSSFHQQKSKAVNLPRKLLKSQTLAYQLEMFSEKGYTFRLFELGHRTIHWNPISRDTVCAYKPIITWLGIINIYYLWRHVWFYRPTYVVTDAIGSIECKLAFWHLLISLCEVTWSSAFKESQFQF